MANASLAPLTSANDAIYGLGYLPRMSADLETLGPLVALLALLALLASADLFLPRQKRKKFHYDRSRWNHRPPPPPTEPYKQRDSAEQLRIVMKSEFSARAVLNKDEKRVFEELCRILSAHKPAWRVLAQVSLGEILQSKCKDARSCINSKRVDMLLMDESCAPRHAIEYQGGGHYRGDAAARDAVKKEALRRAGIGYHEVLAGQTTPADLRRLVERLTSGPDAPTR